MYGEVAEWSKATVSKAVIWATESWVRIPPSPPAFIHHYAPKLSSNLVMQHFIKRQIISPCAIVFVCNVLAHDVLIAKIKERD